MDSLPRAEEKPGLSETEVKARVREMCSHFLVPRPAEKLFSDFDELALLLIADFQPIARAFRGSMSSALSTIGLPFALASNSIHRSHFQRLYAASRIRGLKSTNNWSDDYAHQIADSEMREWSESDTGRLVIINDTCNFLLDSLKHSLESAAHELLQQGLVLVWSAFEVLFRDTFEAMLNRDPRQVQALVAHPSTRKRFEAERLPLEVLVQHAFDLSRRLGTILVVQNDFSDLATIKAVYGVLFPSSSDLNASLSQRDLWILCQRRHLIVHRNAVVDQLYLDSTGETRSLGERLTFTPDHFDGAFDVVVSASTALLRSLPIA